eukprot:UN26500
MKNFRFKAGCCIATFLFSHTFCLRMSMTFSIFSNKKLFKSYSRKTYHIKTCL